MPENVKLQVVVNGGAPQQGQEGGITVAFGDTVQFALSDASGVKTAKYRITEYPEGFALPSGWSEDADDGAYYVIKQNGDLPPLVTMPNSPLWGDFLCDVEVDERKRNGQIAPDLYDGTVGLTLPSPSGTPDFPFLEEQQFNSRRHWVAKLKVLARALDDVIQGTADHGSTGVAGRFQVSDGTGGFAEATQWFAETNGGANLEISYGDVLFSGVTPTTDLFRVEDWFGIHFRGLGNDGFLVDVFGDDVLLLNNTTRTSLAVGRVLGWDGTQTTYVDPQKALYQVLAISGNTTLTSAQVGLKEYTVLCDTTLNPLTLTLPDASAVSNSRVLVRDVEGNASTNNITIADGGGTINVISTGGGWRLMQSDGSIWHVIAL